MTATPRPPPGRRVETNVLNEGKLPAGCAAGYGAQRLYVNALNLISVIRKADGFALGQVLGTAFLSFKLLTGTAISAGSESRMNRPLSRHDSCSVFVTTALSEKRVIVTSSGADARESS